MAQYGSSKPISLWAEDRSEDNDINYRKTSTNCNQSGNSMENLASGTKDQAILAMKSPKHEIVEGENSLLEPLKLEAIILDSKIHGGREKRDGKFDSRNKMWRPFGKPTQKYELRMRLMSPFGRNQTSEKIFPSAKKEQILSFLNNFQTSSLHPQKGLVVSLW